MVYRTSVCQRIKNYHSYASIRWYTLVYASGTSGIGCIRFKHRVIRWHTSRQQIIFLSCLKIVCTFRRMVYAKHMLNTLEDARGTLLIGR